MSNSNSNSNNNGKAIKGFIWRFLERIAAQAVGFVVSIIIARIVEPEAYGVIAIVQVFIAVLQVFVDSGLGTALIQKKDPDDLDYSSVFYFNILMSIALYVILFFISPLIARFYDNDILTPVLRVLGITILISGVKGIQQSYVSKHLQFKKFFYATLSGTIIAAAVGIAMAYKGFGVWALVAQYLVNLVIDTIVLWFVVDWRPKLMFSGTRLKALLSFGWKMLVSKLVDTLYTNIRSLIIGKQYSSADLAYYNRGEVFPLTIISNINTSIDSVLLPVMSEAQDSKASIKALTRRSIKVSTYVMAPILMGLASCGKSIILLLLTDKWMPAYPFMVIFCITYMFWPVHTANLNAIKAMGRSDLFLTLEIIKKLVGISAILITFRISIMAMAYSLLVTSVLSQIINSWPNKKLMNYGYLEQLKDILPGIGLAMFMGGCVYCINFLNLNNWLTIIIQVPLGVAIFIGFSALFKLEAFSYCLNTAKPFINKVLKRNKTENQE